MLAMFILSGWLFPRIKIIYLAVLVLWFCSWKFIWYCPPTRWEFLLRRKYDKSIDPNSELITYYMYKFFKIDIPSKNILTGGLMVFIILVALTLIM